MASVYDSLYNWAKRTTTSFADLRVPALAPQEAPSADGLIYRLKHWPELSRQHRTADVLRALSMMSHRPVNRHWILANTRLQARQVDLLLRRLVDEGAVEVVDAGDFRAGAT